MAAPQTSRFDQFLRRHLNLKSGFSADVPDTIMPVLNVLDPADPTHAHARGESRVSGQRAQPAIAANVSVVEAMAGAGHLLVVTQMVISTGVASTISIVINPGQLLSAQVGANPFFRTDGRDLKDVGIGNEVGGKGAANMFRETLGAVPGTGICATFNTPAGSPVILPCQWILFTNDKGTGTRLQITDDTVNDPLTVWLLGYERLLEPGETF